MIEQVKRYKCDRCQETETFPIPTKKRFSQKWMTVTHGSKKVELCPNCIIIFWEGFMHPGKAF